MKKNVAVLMATYNSERYMRIQIDSILAQKDVNVCLLVRDDGSTDGTVDILRDYASRGELKYYTGKNLKSARCFMQLLFDAPDADYYAFSDHDDFWQEDKLITAVNALNASGEKPALYLSQPQATDADFNLLPCKQFNPQGGFGESMVYWFAMGCTMLFNKNLREIINSYQPDFLYMHDVWIYSIAYAVDADVIWDPVPHTLNRQHGGNVVGLDANALSMLKLRIERFLNGKEVRYRQALELKKGFSKYIPDTNAQILDRFINAKRHFHLRVSLLFDNHYRCSDYLTQYLFWVNLIFNKY